MRSSWQREHARAKSGGQIERIRSGFQHHPGWDFKILVVLSGTTKACCSAGWWTCTPPRARTARGRVAFSLFEKRKPNRILRIENRFWEKSSCCRRVVAFRKNGFLFLESYSKTESQILYSNVYAVRNWIPTVRVILGDFRSGGAFVFKRAWSTRYYSTRVRLVPVLTSASDKVGTVRECTDLAFF